LAALLPILKADGEKYGQTMHYFALSAALYLSSLAGYSNFQKKPHIIQAKSKLSGKLNSENGILLVFDYMPCSPLLIFRVCSIGKTLYGSRGIFSNDVIGCVTV
jgi:hypothetical protein